MLTFSVENFLALLRGGFDENRDFSGTKFRENLICWKNLDFSGEINRIEKIFRRKRKYFDQKKWSKTCLEMDPKLPFLQLTDFLVIFFTDAFGKEVHEISAKTRETLCR